MALARRCGRAPPRPPRAVDPRDRRKPRKSGKGGAGGSSGAGQPGGERKDPEGPEPPRITGRVAGLSVKRQVRIVQQQKKVAGGGYRRTKGGKVVSTGGVGGGYRRQLTEEELEERARQRRLKECPLTLRNLYAGGTREPPVMLVDGYNVCAQWPHIREHFFGGRLEEARDALLHELADYMHVRGLLVRCVFDAHGFQGHRLGGYGRGPGIVEKTNMGVEVVNTDLATADMYIELTAKELLDQEPPPPSVWVATGDFACANIVSGLGGYAISSKYLISDIKRVQREADAKLARINAQRKPRTGILAGADSKTAAALNALRMGSAPAPAAEEPEEEEEEIDDGWDDVDVEEADVVEGELGAEVGEECVLAVEADEIVVSCEDEP